MATTNAPPLTKITVQNRENFNQLKKKTIHPRSKASHRQHKRQVQ